MNKLFIIGIVIVGVIALASLAVSIVGLVGVNQLSQLVKNIPSYPLGGTTNYDTLSLGEDLIVTDESTLGEETIKWVEGSIPSGSNQICEQISTATTTIDLAEMGWSTGVASSTYVMGLFATTSATVSANYDDDAALTAMWTGGGYTGSQLIIPSTSYATSTVGTTTSTMGASKGMTNGEAIVPPSSYVCLYMLLDDVCMKSLLCEPATSTARGMDPLYKIRYHR